MYMYIAYPVMLFYYVSQCFFFFWLHRVGTNRISRDSLPSTSQRSKSVAYSEHVTLLMCYDFLCRNSVEKEEKKTLVQAGVNVTDRVFTPEEVRVICL